MTLREQIAASIGRWALEQPIEHNVEEAREPRFTVPAEPPEPDPGEIDIARVHITAWVAAPCYESEILDFEVCTVAQVNFAVKNTSAQFQDIPMEYVPTIPQLGRDFASYVAFSSWLPETDKVVQVVDATAIGGGTFAAYVQTPFNQQSILMNLVEGWPAGLQAFIGGSDRPMCTGRQYQAVPGNVIKIPGPGMVPRWCEELRAPLGKIGLIQDRHLPPDSSANMCEGRQLVLRHFDPDIPMLMLNRETPLLHVYTDGSANEKASGYAAVILLQIGVTFAVFGLLGGQLQGDPDAP
eukprot:s5732_g2.t1